MPVVLRQLKRLLHMKQDNWILDNPGLGRGHHPPAGEARRHWAALALKLWGLGCLLSMLALGGCTPSEVDEEDAPAPQGPSAAPLNANSVAEFAPDELVLSGDIVADANHTARVFPLVGGRVERVDVELGDEVRKGQVLAVLHSGEIASLQNQSTAGTADLAVARKDLAVAEELFAAGLVAEQDVYRARKELARATGTATKNQRQLNVYNLSPDGIYTLRAPLSGFVTEKNLTTGTRFGTANVQAAFTVANLDSVWVLANVFEADLAKVRHGQAVTITTLSYPDRPLHDRIDRVLNVLEHESKALRVRCTLPNPGHLLKPGMHAQVRVLGPTAPSATTEELALNETHQ
jgi:cobalt-zinc-cadmium efflux system membrane fusion protein